MAADHMGILPAGLAGHGTSRLQAAEEGCPLPNADRAAVGAAGTKTCSAVCWLRQLSSAASEGGTGWQLARGVRHPSFVHADRRVSLSLSRRPYGISTDMSLYDEFVVCDRVPGLTMISQRPAASLSFMILVLQSVTVEWTWDT